MSETHLRRLLGEDLLELVRAQPSGLRRVDEITGLPAAGRTHASFRLRFADGSSRKARLVERDTRPTVSRSSCPASADPGCPGSSRSAAGPSSKSGLRVRGFQPPVRIAGSLAPAGHCSASCTRPTPPVAADPAPTLATLERHARELCDRGSLAPATCAAALRAACAAEPSTPAPVAVIHRDFCAENLVIDRRGRVHAIDNETLRVGPCDLDLARTWYRWPMDHASWSASCARVRRHRAVGAFRAHFDF